MKLGHEGKSIYWDLIEMLYEQNGYLLLSMIENYAFGLRTKVEVISSLIENFDLFIKDDQKFWSESVLSRLKIRKDKSDKARQSANFRHRASKNDAIAENNNAIAENNITNESKNDANKVKEIKVNESKVNFNINRPTIFEIRTFCEDNKLIIDPDYFFDAMTSSGWLLSNGNPCECWQAVLKNWNRNQISWTKDGKTTKSGAKFKTKAEISREALEKAASDIGG